MRPHARRRHPPHREARSDSPGGASGESRHICGKSGCRPEGDTTRRVHDRTSRIPLLHFDVGFVAQRAAAATAGTQIIVTG